MLGSGIIVFREVLEAALVIGIVMAGSKGVAGRGLWVGGGVIVGVLAAGIVALFAGTIAAAAAGVGQELFNASILFVAVIMLGWHCVWMGRHGRDIARHMAEVSRAVAAGSRPLYALGVVVGVAVVREGSEVVLFLYGIAAGGGIGAFALGLGGILGLVAGAGVGLILYFGLLRIPTRYLFAVTTWMIVFLAAGMAVQSVLFLEQAGTITVLGQTAWDTSWILSEPSLPGRILHTLIGYTDQPTAMQLTVYLAILAVTFVLMRLYGAPAKTVRPAPAE